MFTVALLLETSTAPPLLLSVRVPAVVESGVVPTVVPIPPAPAEAVNVPVVIRPVAPTPPALAVRFTVPAAPVLTVLNAMLPLAAPAVGAALSAPLVIVVPLAKLAGAAVMETVPA